MTTTDVKLNDRYTRLLNTIGAAFDSTAVDTVAEWIAYSIPVTLWFLNSKGELRKTFGRVGLESGEYKSWRAAAIESGEAKPSNRAPAHTYGNVNFVDESVLAANLEDGFSFGAAYAAAIKAFKVERLLRVGNLFLLPMEEIAAYPQSEKN